MSEELTERLDPKQVIEELNERRKRINEEHMEKVNQALGELERVRTFNGVKSEEDREWDAFKREMQDRGVTPQKLRDLLDRSEEK
ncbi:hypothetical protein [Pseudalkalibacillus caeni]|uniref:Uncharacterized protein n=1 Tax=Exobacillus caeni TaxID=2574798 RepID=A0A5R9F0W3_9BACL|nr:hypothetical protein [Pseudalkalibacillus caeni]TLS36060.1 hypothetical protein FCL54_16850 [Pseudalkalibacillus caeni]